MRIYIAGPMTGYDEFNFPAFRLAEEELVAAGYEAITPVHEDDLNDDGTAAKPYHWYLKRDMRLLLDADGVATLDGWEQSNGASLEVDVARRLGMIVRPLILWTSNPVEGRPPNG